MFELKPCCPDYTTPMIHNLKPCIPFDNLLDVFLFTLCKDGEAGIAQRREDSPAANVAGVQVSSSGCKESQFYSLPFGQAVASMY